MPLTRRDLLKLTGSAAFGATFGPSLRRAAAAEADNVRYDQKPNVLWIMAEDISPELGCYGHPAVKTPNLDKLAAEGIRYTDAFCTAPVCSPSRSAMITGMYQTTIGAHNHRSNRNTPLPEGVRLITDYLREAGYYTCNVTTAAPGVKGSGKTDFNFKANKPFDGNDWKDRKPGQPFFAQLSLPASHRSFAGGHKWSQEQGLAVDPAKVVLPPIYPDHPVAREDWAAYLDCMQLVDWQVGEALKRLKQEGIADNTVVFFIGDNGQCHVWGKQWLYEGGVHIPLLVRWPGRIRPGQVRDDLVLAIDISATILRLAGVKLPANMEGRVFLGPETKKRDYVVAARDRCDETVDRIRCVRTKQFKYIRNFMPDRPYTQHNDYKEKQYPVLNLLKELHAQGKLTPAQDRFMADRRPEEELYDLQKDPYETNNLAGLPEYKDKLAELRGILEEWIRKTDDKGQYPEKDVPQDEGGGGGKKDKKKKNRA